MTEGPLVPIPKKHEPVSDIDTVVVDSHLTLNGRLEKPTLLGAVGTAEKCQGRTSRVRDRSYRAPTAVVS